MDIVQLSIELSKLKRILRTGWVRHFVHDPEDVADHSWRCAILAMLLGDQLGVDKEKLIKMLLIHDIGEIKSGDIVTDDGPRTDKVLQEKKEKIESETIKKLFSSFGSQYIDLFEEFLALSTPEAKIAKQIDKLEMVIQALEYEKEQGKDLTTFFVNTKRYITHPVLLEIFDKVQKEREKII